MAQMRGTAIQIGNLPGARSLSATAQLAATAMRLRQAGASGDVTEIQSALLSVSALQLPHGVPISAEVQDLAAELRQRITEDEDLARLDALRRSRSLKHQVRRLWDLMVAESDIIRTEAGVDPADSQSAGGEVSREGYRQMHMRIAKALVENGGFDAEEAHSISDQDWAEDIARFSGTNHISVWLDDIRNKFREAAAQAVALHGFTGLFARYDTDGSGELDMSEFFAAVRSDLGIDVTIMTDDELEALFRQVDVDGGGEVDAKEFVQWLFHAEEEQKARVSSRKKRIKAHRATAATEKASAVTRLKRRFKEASSSMTEDIGWDLVFEKYDDDGSGELEIGEFAVAVRQECGLTENAVSNEEISELFGVIDADQSGAIDSKELKVLLTADLNTPTMTFLAFHSSMYVPLPYNPPHNTGVLQLYL
jgi:Ca2+-binding EF-hand superfamily protein